MKRAIFLKFLALSLVLAAGTVGCQKKHHPLTFLGNNKGKAPGDSNPSPPLDPSLRPVPPGPGPTTQDIDTGANKQNIRIEGDYIVDIETFKANTVYFDFDSAAVKPSEKAKIQAVASVLKSESTSKLRMEGHCDERGTDQYNLALGERRALAIREVLIAEGVSGDRVMTQSFGEEKPAVQGHDETAWAKNRRGEFLLLKPKP